MTTNFPKPLDKQVAAISDSLSQTQDGLAIVANGNTHAAISSGQFVYVKGHDTLSEGLYKATSAIAANGALSTSNLTPDGAGGLNDLQSQLTALNSNITAITKNVNNGWEYVGTVVVGSGNTLNVGYNRELHIIFNINNAYFTDYYHTTASDTDMVVGMINWCGIVRKVKNSSNTALISFNKVLDIAGTYAATWTLTASVWRNKT